MTFTDIRNLIGQGDTEGALTALLSFVEEGSVHNRRLRNDLLVLQNRYSDVRNKELTREFETGQAAHEYTLLHKALLNLIDELESNQTSPQAAHHTGSTAPDSRPWSRWLAIGGVALLVLVAALFLFRRQPTDPVNPGTVTPPKENMNIAGIWHTNAPPLMYSLEQQGDTYTWQVIGASDRGTGRIEGNSLIMTLPRGPVVYSVTARFPDGTPRELKSQDPAFAGLVLFKRQQ